MNKIRAILADDESNLLRYMQEMLLRLWPELEIVGEAANGMEALALIREEEPDIAFLDIRMPVLDGLQVARRIKGECHVVFITAYDEYAVQAFESAAIDYLLKPVDESRLEETLIRIKQLISQRPAADKLEQIINQLTQETDHSKVQYLAWIRAGEGEQTHMIPVDDIFYFKAEDKYTTVKTAQKEYLIRKSIRELVFELDPDRFWQIHRGTIVQLDQIDYVKKALNGSGRLFLKNVAEELTVSRRYSHLFKQM